MSSVLHELNRVARDLLQFTLDARVGAAEFHSQEKPTLLPESERLALAIRRKVYWLRNQSFNQQALVHSYKVPYDPNDRTAPPPISTSKGLSNDEIVEHSSRNAAVKMKLSYQANKRQQGVRLIDALNAAYVQTTAFYSSNMSKEDALVRSLAQERDQLSLKLLSMAKEADALQARAIQLEDTIRVAHLKNRALLQEVRLRKQEKEEKNQILHTLFEKQEEEKPTDRNEEYYDRSLAMLRGMITGLVLESGIDWAANPNLRSVMLSLEEE
ncbi:hypothetical protein THASP1DRAFT_27848 [Thamnocephalis sphaerospora]|uniref:Centromere protein H C-terminal domain-containing protein n=1 Tax=Thamnocephalis sphaerospora TaxID=78915 RepID=A0A4P9XVR1_9FUNG|nr:hypothetical protein THASP1DRAFT_27848 [Thamnocephalis sphaerospora]|eukprot:RKP10364.1 hypothetical protein THASP1DRAFT_27848 [Thamnocephalis sphaerospora]